MKKINVINFHITDKCNYSCKYCFGKFDKGELNLSKAKNVIDSIADYFTQSNIKNGRVNFAGGEPLLYPYLDKIIDYCYKKNIKVSLVTNGSLLTSNRIIVWKDKVCQIGISIDSINNDTCLNIGRCCNNKTIDIEHLTSIANTMKKCGISLKINTVISNLNNNEDLTELYLALAPEKIKLFQMHIVKGINDDSEIFSISNNDFINCCKKYETLKVNVIVEKQGDMENSYLMIDPSGTLIINDRGRYKKFDSLINCGLYNQLISLPLDYDKFMFRYDKES